MHSYLQYTIVIRLTNDPFQIEHICTLMHRRVTWTGGAINAIDLALWDINGKALVYELFGGKVRDSVPLYANGRFSGKRPSAHGPQDGGEPKRGPGTRPAPKPPYAKPSDLTSKSASTYAPASMSGAPAGSRNNWNRSTSPGWKSPFSSTMPIPWPNSPARCACRWPPASSSTPAGSFALLEQLAIGIIQPDICHAGGFSELRKIAAMAETYFVTLAPHNSNSPRSTVASLHLDMAINNCHMQGVFLNSVDLYHEVLPNPHRHRRRQRHATRRAGLGHRPRRRGLGEISTGRFYAGRP